MIILDTLLMLGGLLFAVFTVNNHHTYNTRDSQLDKVIIAFLWLSVFSSNLIDVLKYFNQ